MLNAVVGFAGLAPTMWALEHGVTLALANKESLVAAGDARARRAGAGRRRADPGRQRALGALPVRAARRAGEPRPHRERRPVPRPHARRARPRVTPEEALAHPTWSMGPKITIDSATLANKGLEMIEAHFLFGVAYDRIEVVIHPTSIVHGLVRFRDGAAIAHLGYPDMRVPISYALTYPERAATPVPPLELRTLEFHEPDTETFRMLALAREAGERGGTYPCAYNAANEVAVQAFLEGRIGFLEIAALVEDVLDRVDGSPARDLDELVEADRRARELVAVRLVSIGVAILGARRPDPRPRGGPLLRRARGRDAAAEVLPRLRPAAREDDAQRRRVRHRGVPARRLREDPGHAPAGGRATCARRLKPEEQQALEEPLDALDAALERGDDETARAQLPALEAGPRQAPRAPGARRLARARRLLAADDVEAHRRDRGRARDEHRLRGRDLRRALHARHDAGDAHGRPRDRRPPRRGGGAEAAATRSSPSPATRSRPTRSRAASTPRRASRSRSSSAATASASSSAR